AGSATLLVETALLSQSRGALFGFVAAGILYLALQPRKAVTLASAAGIGLLVAVSWAPITDVRNAPRASAIGSELADARRAIGISVALSAAAALVAIAAARRPDVRELFARDSTRRAGRYLVIGVAAAAVIAAAVAIGNPASWTSDRWHDFKSSGYTTLPSGQTRFTGSLGSSRYDFYRVALDEFAHHPVQGIGADNFAEAYVRHRRTLESPRYPHSVAFRVLSQLGAVGVVLFVAFLAFAWQAARHARLVLRPVERALGVAALAGFAMWLMHGMFDWLWEFPALGILAVALLAIAMRMEADAPQDPDAAIADAFESPYEDQAPLHAAVRAWPERAVVGIAGIAAVASFALPGIAARYTSGAYHDFRTDPGRTLARLERAAELNFLSPEPLVAKGVVAEQLGLPGVARDALRRAVDRDPSNWYAQFELAMVDATNGRPSEAQATLRKAMKLNPRQPLISEVAARVMHSQPIDPVAVQGQLYAQLRDRLGPTQGTHPDRP
ncbi:MAG: O-antigen ligase family protein, partial [Thermoleophilaceae bacterium]